ncbi:MAG: 3-oxo-5-alpha-steroid 4-dehydrogenase [Fimbriimonadaceae bacterium]|nr:3-oxo-5-alpha-steroid 4-dehydrogenase [Alphaproteobacteria bacterium]
MEAGAPVTFAIFFIIGPGEKTGPLLIMFLLWMTHYIHRAFIFPWRTRTVGKVIPVIIVASAVCFNFVNGWSIGWYLGSGIISYSNAWFWDARFYIGLIVFLIGACINVSSDNMLLRLRSENDAGYSIPYGGLFRFVSCPNHLGEIIQWFGFAVLCWTLPTTAFAIWTTANLTPRALAHHKWYKTRFPGYPSNRKALIPYLL